ncbi:SusD/RagB family nutrient-binding outer membrane lipoprotein [Sphingobacterium shayense]|uniref:SusD/RagB family nutrient-binding outer membrane lipoprotein n=1 Tax=Sphingobacterium shayense TaxID=626343 RepID=UPI0015570EEF|nr:SusD/RagB family nutrient-binding outer membrane lipoprotein [Sphingobacterium shayense]NQD71508.1 SusD/RagB family nutrient-binding outer membrane lipoprotein [Sphingobacterium shayense]
MKIKFNKYTTLACLTFGLAAASCTKSFEDVNTDPDAFTEVPTTNILANVLRNTGQSFGGDVAGYGTFAGYIVKIQYLDYLGDLIPTNNTYGNRWAACYYNNTQLDILLETTEEKADLYKNVRFVARIWQNYMWSYLTEGWRDVPYSQALQGREEDGSVLKAQYDKQEDIYPALLQSLKTIADEMADGLGTDDLGDGDFIYHRNGMDPIDEVKNWQKFCNSLRLRLAMRISAVAPDLAKSTIEEIAGDPTKYPVLETNEENCYLTYPGGAPYYEPWNNDGYVGKRIDNYGMSDIFIDHLIEMEDPRIAKVANKASDGTYRGFQNGAEASPSPLTTISFIGDKYMKDPAGFTPFYKSAETFYIYAEAAMLGYNVGMTAKDAYEKAVRLSMEDNQIASAAVDAYLAGKGKWNNTKERIWWDMWVALFKENFEAWSLYRRTGIPSTNYPSLNSVFGDAHNDQPFRLPYPNNEFLYNTENVNQANSNVKDYAWGEQMWWDQRSDVF